MTTYYLVNPQSGQIYEEYNDLKQAKKAARGNYGTVFDSSLRRQIVSKPWVCILQDGEMRWVYRPRA